MKTLIAIFNVVSWLALPVRAVLPVIDAAHIAVSQAHQVVNYVQWVEQQLNTLHTYEEEVLYLARFGDASMLRQLPGVSDVAQLVNTGRQLQQQYQSLSLYFNPQNYLGDLNNILGTYSQPAWNGFTTLSGVLVPPLQGSYQFDTARFNIANTVQHQMDALETQRQQLEAQRDSALVSLQAASTDQEVQKYHSIVNGLNGALADINGRVSELQKQATLRGEQINAGQQVYKASQIEQKIAGFYKGVDADLAGLPSGDFHQTVDFPQ